MIGSATKKEIAMDNIVPTDDTPVKLLITDDSQVAHLIKEVRPYLEEIFLGNPKQPVPVKVLSDRIEMVKNIVNRETQRRFLLDYDENFKMIGSCALTELEREHKFDLEAFTRLLRSKHDLYTDKPLRRWGPVGITIRIDSKVSRYKEVKQKLEKIRLNNLAVTVDERKQFGETSEDTITDILGYAILGLLLVREEKITQVTTAPDFHTPGE
jgi:hypothetical protein